MIENTPFTLWDGHVRMAARGIVVLVFVDDEILTKAATWILKCMYDYIYIICWDSALKRISWSFMLQMNNGPRHTLKACSRTMSKKTRQKSWPEGVTQTTSSYNCGEQNSIEQVEQHLSQKQESDITVSTWSVNLGRLRLASSFNMFHVQRRSEITEVLNIQKEDGSFHWILYLKGLNWFPHAVPFSLCSG